MAPPTELSSQMLQQLRQHVDAALATPPAAPAAAPAAVTDFCAIWPTAKQVLQFLVGILTILPIPIPGGGAAAAAALNALISVGDQIYQGTCSK
jgi:hypothetical protein